MKRMIKVVKYLYYKEIRLHLVTDAYDLYQRQQLYVPDDVLGAAAVVHNIRQTLYVYIRPLLGRLVTENLGHSR